MPKISPSKNAKTYRELRTELDTLLSQLQDPDCDIDTATKLYEAALERINLLERYLEQAENQINKVRVNFASGTES